MSELLSSPAHTRPLCPSPQFGRRVKPPHELPYESSDSEPDTPPPSLSRRRANAYSEDCELEKDLADKKRNIHNPKSTKCLLKLLGEKDAWKLLGPNEHHEYPLHSIIRQCHRDRVKMVEILLLHTSVNINAGGELGMTALHYAVQCKGDDAVAVVVLLLTFGADPTLANSKGYSPLDLVKEQMHSRKAVNPHKAKYATCVDSPLFHRKLLDLFDNDGAEGSFQSSQDRLKQASEDTWKILCKLMGCLSLGRADRKTSESVDSDGSKTSLQDENGSQHLLETNDEVNASDEKAAPIGAKLELQNVRQGSRILFLDGGGMRGLIEIEILQQLEQRTGRKVTELFDWIVGTSTGGILALALVYASKSLTELRQLYFKMRDKVFGSGGYIPNTERLEKLLKSEFGEETRLHDVTSPKVLIAAVNKEALEPDLHFFNNCSKDGYSHEKVWKVARYTSAAPVFFKDLDDYIDGGVLANNPCTLGLSAIQKFHREKHGEKLKVALIVSVGSGNFPLADSKETKKGTQRTDFQEVMHFGKHWLKAVVELVPRTKGLLIMLSNAFSNTELMASSFGIRMKDQDIPFYRLNPELEVAVPTGETDLMKLVNMIMETKLYLSKDGLPMMEELVQRCNLVQTS